MHNILPRFEDDLTTLYLIPQSYSLSVVTHIYKLGTEKTILSLLIPVCYLK